jgi:hypothetical protein
MDVPNESSSLKLKVKDKDGKELSHGDRAEYTDTRNKKTAIFGLVRYNGFLDRWEVIADDLQSGWFLNEVTIVTKK